LTFCHRYYIRVICAESMLIDFRSIFLFGRQLSLSFAFSFDLFLDDADRGKLANVAHGNDGFRVDFYFLRLYQFYHERRFDALGRSRLLRIIRFLALVGAAFSQRMEGQMFSQQLSNLKELILVCTIK